MPRLPLPTTAFPDFDAVLPELARHVAAMATGESPAAACTMLASLERHGLLAIDPGDNDLGELCRAVRQGATTPCSQGAVPACSSRTALCECLCASIRAVLGATLLSEYGRLSPQSSKRTDAQLVSSPGLRHRTVQLRVVTTMCRRMTKRGIVSAQNALRLAAYLFTLVQAKKCKRMAFEVEVYHDILAHERLIVLLAREMVQFKTRDPEVAGLLVLVWLQANRFAQSHFREWRTSSTAKLPIDIQREEDAWVRELDDNTPANVQRIWRTLMLCFGPQRIADTVCVEKLGPERALASVFYPDTLQFYPDTGGKTPPLFCADTGGKTPPLFCADTGGKAPPLFCADTGGQAPPLFCVDTGGKTPSLFCGDTGGKSPPLFCVDTGGKTPPLFCGDTGGKAPPLFCADTPEDVRVANEQWRVPCARAGETLPDYVADYFAIVWDILYEPTTPVTAPMRCAVACEFLYRVAATVRQREASCFVPV